MFRFLILSLALVFSAESYSVGIVQTLTEAPAGWTAGPVCTFQYASSQRHRTGSDSECAALGAPGTFDDQCPNALRPVASFTPYTGPNQDTYKWEWAVNYPTCNYGNYGNMYIADDHHCDAVDGVMGMTSDGNKVCVANVDPCEINPNSPECQACYPLTPDQWDTDLAQIYGFDDQEFCTPEYLSDEQECQNVLGYANDAQVCIDDQESCTAQGGSYGTIAYGDGTPEAVCIPADYASDLPTCDIGTVNVVIPELDGFGFACSETLDPPLPDDPTEDDVIDQDTDGDGIPDRNDPDIDGDGIPNGQDPDVDGDGVPNEDETDSNNYGSVSGGLTCSSRPSCSGDPVARSIVLQTWSTRCEAREMGQGIDRLEAAVRSLQNSVEEGLSADGFDPNAEAISDTEPVPGNFDFQADISSIYNQGGAAGSCPADTVVNTSFGAIAIPWTMLCEFASTIRPLVIFLFGLAAFRMTMRAF